jgi:hypothetical protein
MRLYKNTLECLNKEQNTKISILMVNLFLGLNNHKKRVYEEIVNMIKTLFLAILIFQTQGCTLRIQRRIGYNSAVFNPAPFFFGLCGFWTGQNIESQI